MSQEDNMDRIFKELEVIKKAALGDMETGKPGILEEIRTIKHRQESEAEQTQIYRKRVDTVIENHEKRLDEAEATITQRRAGG